MDTIWECDNFKREVSSEECDILKCYFADVIEKKNEGKLHDQKQ
jgi:hypothetical protein